MSREKLNEELFDVFLIEALRQVEEEELQKSEQFFEEQRWKITFRPSALSEGLNGLIGCIVSGTLGTVKDCGGQRVFC